jgi:hypothetical protein
VINYKVHNFIEFLSIKTMKKLLSSIVLVSGIFSLSVLSVSAASSIKNTLPAPEHLVARQSRSTTTVFLPVLTWKDVSSSEDGFSIERKIGNGTSTEFTHIDSVNRNVTTFTDTTANDLIAGSTSTADIPFIYRVSAFTQTSSSFSPKAVIVSTFKQRNPNATSSPQDFSAFSDYIKTTVSNVNTMLQQQGEKAINSLSSVTKAKASSGKCVNLTKNLSKGSPANTTSKLQDFLIEKGFLPGEASGVYGDFTVEAVKAYQRSIGIPETGKVYDLTRQAIKQETCQ